LEDEHIIRKVLKV